jgi:hypothetical protein
MGNVVDGQLLFSGRTTMPAFSNSEEGIPNGGSMAENKAHYKTLMGSHQRVIKTSRHLFGEEEHK